MRSHLAFPYLGPGLTVVFTVVVLLSIPAADNADAAPLRPHAWSGPASVEVATTTSTEAPSSTSPPGQRRTATESGIVLPLVLAGIIFLALLVPASGFHSHGHWHSR